MKPQVVDKNASPINAVASTAVGRRGTSPVRMKSATTGTPITRAANASTAAPHRKELERAHFLHQQHDRPQNAQPVGVGPQLRGRASRAVLIRRLQLAHRHRQFQRVDGELGFRFEPRGQRREGLHEPAGEGAVTGQHVGHAVAEQMRHDAGQHQIAGAVPGAIGSGDVGDAGGRDHVQRALQQQLQHGGGSRRVIRVVTVHQHVGVGLDVGEHAADHVAFALQQLGPHHCPGGVGGGHRAVGGVVVIDVDRGLGQGAAEALHHTGDRHFLVAARDQHRGPDQRNTTARDSAKLANIPAIAPAPMAITG